MQKMNNVENELLNILNKKKLLNKEYSDVNCISKLRQKITFKENRCIKAD